MKSTAKYLFALFGVALFLSGCAGLATPFIHNPYAGTYTGTFVTSDGKAGPASVQLTELGNVFGTLTDTASKAQGSLTGSVKSGLAFGGSITFPNAPAHSLSGTFVSSGTQITGTLTGPDSYTLKLDVNSKPSD